MCDISGDCDGSGLVFDRFHKLFCCDIVARSGGDNIKHNATADNFQSRSPPFMFGWWVFIKGHRFGNENLCIFSAHRIE